MFRSHVHEAGRRIFAHPKLALDPRQEVAMPDAVFDRDQLAADLDDVLRGAGHPLANAVSGFAKKLFVGFDDCCGGHVRDAIDCSSHEQLATNYFARFASCAASFDL
jgi:hypothetical protein